MSLDIDNARAYLTSISTYVPLLDIQVHGHVIALSMITKLGLGMEPYLSDCATTVDAAREVMRSPSMVQGRNHPSAELVRYTNPIHRYYIVDHPINEWSDTSPFETLSWVDFMNKHVRMYMRLDPDTLNLYTPEELATMPVRSYILSLIDEKEREANLAIQTAQIALQHAIDARAAAESALLDPHLYPVLANLVVGYTTEL